MKKTALLCVVVLGCCCGSVLAVFFTNWPTYAESAVTNWPRSSEYEKLIVDLTWTHNALLERCEVAGISTNGISTLTNNTRLPKEDIQRFKIKTRELLVLFADSSLATNGSYDAWFTNSFSTTNYAYYKYYQSPITLGRTNFPLFSIAGLTARFGLPTNFFEYTPERCLDRVGPFSDDTNVDYTHGWTNEHTAKGGLSYPDSRSRWYTTDYSWTALSNVIHNLVWTWQANQEQNDGRISFWSGSNSSIAQAYYSNVVEWATNEYSGYDNGYVWQCELARSYDGSNYNYHFESLRNKSWPYIYGVSDEMAHAAQCYRVFTHYPFTGGGGYPVYMPDANWDTSWFDDFVPGAEKRDRYSMAKNWEPAVERMHYLVGPTNACWANNPVTMRWPTPPPESASTNTYPEDGNHRWVSIMTGMYGVTDMTNNYGGRLVVHPYGSTPYCEGRTLWLFKWDVENGFRYR